MTREKLKDRIAMGLMMSVFSGGTAITFTTRELWGHACLALFFLFLSAYRMALGIYFLRRWNQYIQGVIKELKDNHGFISTNSHFNSFVEIKRKS